MACILQMDEEEKYNRKLEAGLYTLQVSISLTFSHCLYIFPFLGAWGGEVFDSSSGLFLWIVAMELDGST